MNHLPAPLTPPDCNLRDFDFMPIDVVRLRDSDMAATPDGEVFRAAVLSWSVSWHQVPAASLPDDDAAIARLIGMGRDVAGMVALRAAGALRGFVKCSDGRLYHPVVAEKALTAWEAKATQRNRTQKAREARLSQRQSQTPTKPVTDTVTKAVTVPASPSKGESRERDSEGIVKKEAPMPGVDLVPVKPPPFQIPNWIPVEPWDAFCAMRKKIKKPLTDYATKLMVGKLLKLHLSGEDVGAVLDQSTFKCWQDPRAVQQEGTSFGKAPAHNSFGSTISRVVRKRAGEGLFSSGDEIAGELADSGPADRPVGEDRRLGPPIAAE